MQKKILDNICSPEDLRLLNPHDLPQLAAELRHFIICAVASKAGHLGASLGVVELTIALHYVFQTPDDVLVWDVGHQAYGHKILTGRRDQFHTNRQLGGISGFPRRSESSYDPFGVGHSSTSISAALGMAIAAQLKGEKHHHIAVIGDASIASGIAFEGLNHAGVCDCNLLIVLNDNTMGIDPSVGALKAHLAQLKTGAFKGKNIFEALNFEYFGPIDGHDLEGLISTLKTIKTIEKPVFLHLKTTKGKGLKQAEKHQITYHAPGKFNAETGDLIARATNERPSKYQDVFGHTLVELAHMNTKIVGITPAMPTGSSLKYLMEAIPERAFDVGIAEQHAVTMAAGMAAAGLVPFCNIYSTFLQRAYDQVIHDVALQKLPVIFCLDRAGLVGEDGATHHGSFDLAYLRCIPNLIVFAPRNEVELRQIMYTAQRGIAAPMAIRYPRGHGVVLDWKQPFKELDLGTGVLLKKGVHVAVLTVGTIASHVSVALEGLDFSHYDMRFIKPLDADLLHHIFSHYSHIFTVEDGTTIGGFGSGVLEFASRYNYKIPVAVLGLPDTFVTHGKTSKLYREIGLDPESLRSHFERFRRDFF